MQADPPVRNEGKCAREGCDKKRTMPPKKQRYMPLEVYEAEPFCSRQCCEKHYGIFVKVTTSGTGPGSGRKAYYWKNKKEAIA